MKKGFFVHQKYSEKKRRRVYFLMIILGFLMTFQGMAIGAKKIKIVTTIFPLKEFAEMVSGDRGEVSLLLPPGSEIHTWSPRPSDMVKLAGADLFIYIGADLEPWVNKIQRSIKNDNMKVLEASLVVEIHGSDEKHSSDHEKNRQHGPVDPHIWLDFQFDQIIVARIAEILSELEPQNRSEFQKNALAYQKKLSELDMLFKTGLEECDQKTLVLGGHAAFGYLARRYHLKQVSLYGLSPNARPGPKEMAKIVDMARNNKIHTIFFESFVSDRLARVLAREVGAGTLVLHTGANLTEDQLRSGITFLDLMKINLENLRHGLSCR